MLQHARKPSCRLLQGDFVPQHPCRPVLLVAAGIGAFVVYMPFLTNLHLPCLWHACLQQQQDTSEALLHLVPLDMQCRNDGRLIMHDGMCRLQA